MEFHLIDFIEHILNVVVLFLLLRTFLYDPVSRFMAEREARYADERAQIDAGRAEADALKAKYEASLEDAKREAENLAAEKLRAAEREAEDIRAKARQEAQRALAQAHAQAQFERGEMLGELKDQTALLAIDLAGRILGREVSAADNQSLIDGFFEKVG
ncbi:MAG TPA: F0F1 ATP synthase subunit B [Clostridia bacterium]|jgi:F-type H+-transporting ATPase subunit b|nr:MAG: ATP synthase subunit b, sodium ion specific [Firmicutes bacterium ADurb.Bin248]HOG00884.1 F0F1 ATP synthase subunit B [Clostridia bacterium]HOS19552.1 F0F1 ATP synthase subunit B [Clostridia bacterium]HPK15885.1 F0F1 ATP synthase subunit B [Clostridia bacterium]